MARLILSCLGAVELSVDGESLTPFIRGKAGALLIFLAVEFRRAHGRDALAAMLWPEHDRKRALQNLRQLLVVIRRTLPADLQVILAERNHIQFVPSDLAEIDVHAFERKAAGSERALASLYRGPFLVDHPDMKSEEWDTWIRARRQDFELQAMDAFQRLGEEFLAAGDFEGALSMARRRLDCDPWNEDAHRAAMLVLALTGRRNAALNQFAVCRDRLDEDLGVAPDPATLSLFEQIRDGKVVPQVAVAPADPSERRHVTALLVQKMFPLDADPEDLLNQGLDLERLTPLVEGLGGLVERCAEDWLLAYFGGHGSWERAAQRAVSAGLAIVAGEPASLRAAVHSGPAVMHGGVTSRITGALSQVVRAMAELAGPGSVVVSNASRALITQPYSWTALPVCALPGLPKDFSAFRVAERGEGPASDAAAVSPSPLVGRRSEWAALLAAARAAAAGRGGAVAIVAEAGLGKTRLLQELWLRHDSLGLTWHQHDCLPEFAHLPLQPFTDMVCGMVGVSPGDHADAKRERVLQFLAEEGWGEDPVRSAALAGILGVSLGGEGLAPRRGQRARLDLMVDLVGRRARRAPLILALEDVHWADKSSLMVLARLAEMAANLPLLLVCTGRLHSQRDWQAHLANARPLRLAALERAEMAALVRSIRPDISEARLEHVVERANGVAAFARELALAGDEGDRLPMSLEAGLQARLDALPEAKTVARLAASIGIEFPLNLFHVVAGRHPRESRADLINGLRSLVDNGMLDIQRRGGQIVYRFRHALVRDAIYATQIRRERGLNHLLIAQALEVRGGAPPVLLAWHFQEAGRVTEAVSFWCVAAEQALATGDAEQAIVNGENGLETLHATDDAHLHPEAEIRLRLALGSAHGMLKGYSTQAAEKHFSRAMAVSGAVAATPVGVAALFGFYSVLSFRWRWAEARTISERLNALARTRGDTATVAVAHYAAGHSAYYGGRIDEALAIFERMPPPDEAGNGLNTGHAIDLRPYARSMHAMALWLVGRRAEGLAAMDEVVARCQGRPVEQAPVVTMWAYLSVFRRDHAALAEAAARLRQLCDRGGLMQWKALVLIAAGLSAGFCPEAETVDAAFELWSAAELGPTTPTLLFLVVAAHHQSGRWEAAVRCADQLLEQTGTAGAHFYDAETLWMRGQSLAALGRWDETEETLCRALAMAGRCGMAALELRILTAQTRLHHARGETKAVTALLPAIARRLTGSKSWDEAEALDLLAACDYQAARR